MAFAGTQSQRIVLGKQRDAYSMFSNRQLALIPGFTTDTCTGLRHPKMHPKLLHEKSKVNYGVGVGEN